MRRYSSVYEQFSTAPRLQLDRINPLTTNSLLTGKFTGNCKDPFTGRPRRPHYRATATRRCNMVLPGNPKLHRHVLLLGADQLGELALDAVGKRRDPFSF
jgi:hypothetical protein